MPGAMGGIEVGVVILDVGISGGQKRGTSTNAEAQVGIGRWNHTPLGINYLYANKV